MRVVLGWSACVLLLAALGFACGLNTVLPGPSATATLMRNPAEVRAIQAGIPPTDGVLILLSSATHLVTDPEFSTARDSLITELSNWGRSDDESPLNSKLFSKISTATHLPPLPEEALFVSADSHYLLIDAATNIPVNQSAKALKDLPQKFANWQKQNGEFSLKYLSEGTGDNEIFELINRDLDRSLIYTVPLSLVILLWAFGSVVSSLIPLVVAITSLIASLGVSAIFSHIVDPVSATASQLVVLLVMAIGVDYSLFMVSRVREEVRLGLTYRDAVSRARSRSGISIFWSGLTVALSLTGLLLMHDTILTSMALVSILSVIITVAASILVLPSLLLLLERHLERGHLRDTFKSVGFSSRWVTLGVRHPVLSITFCLGALLSVGLLTREMKLGSTVERDLLPPSMQSAKTYAVLKEHFPNLAGTSLSVIISGPNLPQVRAQGKTLLFIKALLDTKRLTGPLSTDKSSDGTVERFEFLVRGNANEAENRKLIEDIRKDLAPRLLENSGITVGVSGNLPFVVDEKARYTERTPWVLGAVVLVSAIFLLIAFRSIAVAIKAMLLNLLSTGASFGLMVLLFQHQIVDAWQYGVIESFVPALLFSILFGLSMDYHVFLLSRIQEEAMHGGSTADAVQRGISATSRTITSAALIMAGVFAIIATLELPVMKQLGVGLAIAVVLDATIIRSLLLPASMVLLGKWNWYLPSWLQWLPRVRVD